MGDRGKAVAVKVVPAEESQEPAAPGSGDVELVGRFLLGLLLLGGEELALRLRATQQEVEANTELISGGPSAGDERPLALVRYAAIEATVRGHRRVSRDLQRAMRFSADLIGRATVRLNQMTNHPLLTPWRERLALRRRDLRREGQRLVAEGQVEEKKARLLAGGTLSQIFDDVLAYAVEDSELEDIIVQEVKRQSEGLTDAAATNAQRLTAEADGVVEGVVRRLLRRKPRRDLPSSPLGGEPQTVYAVHRAALEAGSDGG